MLVRWTPPQQPATDRQKPSAITEVLSSGKKNRHLIPMWQNIDILESIHAALTPLLEFTDSLSGESYVTVSYVKPVLHLFRSSLLKVNEGDTQLTKELKTKIMTTQMISLTWLPSWTLGLKANTSDQRR